VVRDAVVDVDERGRISYCGPAREAPPTGARVAELTGILLPGLVNAHAHSPMSLLRGMGGDLPLLRWLREVIWPSEALLRPADIESGMLLGLLEMLRAGVTTTAEMYFHGEQLATAVLDSGARALLTMGILDAPGWSWRAMLDDVTAWIDADGLRSGPDERIEIGYGPHSAYTLPPEALALAGEAARARDALVHIHVAESATEDTAQRDQYGSVPTMLASLGVLDGRVIAAHAVHLSDQDIETFATHRVGVAHCPGSNAKLASGIARIVDLRRAGVPIGLGTDGPASNDDLDLWEDMRLAAMLARLSTMDSTALGAAEVLLMATRGGADALGRHDIGALEKGRWADLVHAHVDDPAFAAGLGVPDEHLLANLVWAAGSRTVRDVWVAGEQVVEAGETTRVDRAGVLAAASAITQRLLAQGALGRV
jgi:5-methylthioadenosine/S-adenosylhomocysteine deaminase